MPKRPCAITVTPDDSTVLCGDKFGDVYALPLLGQPHEPSNTNGGPESELAMKTIKNGSQRFVPSATSLTVHTKRNLHALKQQLQHGSNNEKSVKKSLDFEHKLTCGHVSLLTDVVCTKPTANARSYIITSDRDEHVRVSRGIPQAHIIEGYCHGHTEFISKLCLIPSRPELLLTGGGDDFLILWDWLAGTVKQRINISEIIHDFKKSTFVKESLHTPSNDSRFVVSNIQSLEPHREKAGELHTELAVTCEGVPALFLFTIDAQDQIKFRQVYSTEGNVIDMVAMSDRTSILCSLDNTHQWFSTSTNDDQTRSRPLIDAIYFSKRTQLWEKDSYLYAILSPVVKEAAERWPVTPQTNVAKGKSLKDLLYGLGSLRKHGTGGEVNPDHDEEEEGA